MKTLDTICIIAVIAFLSIFSSASAQVNNTSFSDMVSLQNNAAYTLYFYPNSGCGNSSLKTVELLNNNGRVDHTEKMTASSSISALDFASDIYFIGNKNERNIKTLKIQVVK